MTYSSRTRRARMLAAGGAVAIFGLGVWSFSADAAPGQEQQEIDRESGDVYHAADLRGQSRWTTEGEVWPPRPVGAGAPTVLIQTDPPQVARAAAEGQATDNAEVAALLGDRWNVLEVAENPDNGKGQNAGRGRSRITYYSRTTNQSVVVDMTGTRVQNVETVAPTVNQLPVTTEEADDAVIIARQHWLDQGLDRVNDLEGFVIMALQPGGDLFDVRMVYVSFHTDADAVPEFLTWVDLTNEVVSHGREEN